MTYPGRILLIDDDTDDIEFFCMVLNELYPNIEVLAELKSDIAIAKLSHGKISKPNYIFLDLNMPRIDGWNCLSAIRNMPLYNSIPIVMYTTSNHEQHRKTALQRGASYFLTKQDTFNKTREVLSDFFSRRLQETA